MGRRLPRLARTASARRWSCTSMSSRRSVRCTSGRPCPTPSVATCHATRWSRCGSSATASPSGVVARPARSRGGSVGRSSSGIRRVVFPAAAPPHGLHAHHIRHWEDGGPTELWNLVLVCPFHHRSHHRGLITIRGPGEAITVTDVGGRVLDGSSVARPPTTAPPDVAPYAGPTGERAQWKWYDPVAPGASDPPSSN